MKYILTGQLIKRLRHEKRMSMVDFATKINISQPALSRIENGAQEVSITILQNICKECNIKISDFFKMLDDEIDLSINISQNPNLNNEENLEDELIKLVKSIPYEQQKALYVLLFPLKK